MGPDDATTAIDAATIRGLEPDRYLAALLAPRAIKDDLLTLAAFAAELRRIVATASEPFPGELRLQWWRETLTAKSPASSGSPLADAVVDLVRRREVPPETISALLDERAADLYVDPPVDRIDLQRRLAHGEGGLFWLALRVADCDAQPQAELAAALAGEAYGLARDVSWRPARARRGPLVPQDLLTSSGLTLDDLAAGEEASIAPLGAVAAEWALDALERLEAIANGLRGTAVEALLPVVMVRPYLSAQQSRGRGMARSGGEPSPLARAWRLWRAHRRGRL